MTRILTFVFGLFSYALFFGSFLYLIGFTSGLLVPKSINSGETAFTVGAVVLNICLVALFGIQHSVMARPGFKRWWTKIIPPAIERSMFVLLSSVCLIVMYVYWQPMTETVWQVESGIGFYLLWGLSWTGWGAAFLSTFLINHFDLFGLRQVYFHLKNQEYTDIGFRTPFLYKLVRHPLMFGILLAFWTVPHMTVGQLLFNVTWTAYVLFATRLEERDLIAIFGERYKTYRRQVPMLVPWKAHAKPIEGHTTEVN